jgi:hypothetical protein
VAQPTTLRSKRGRPVVVFGKGKKSSETQGRQEVYATWTMCPRMAESEGVMETSTHSARYLAPTPHLVVEFEPRLDPLQEVMRLLGGRGTVVKRSCFRTG